MDYILKVLSSRKKEVGDYSLNQGAPAGHESADTPIGHESNGVVAEDESNGAVAGDGATLQ